MKKWLQLVIVLVILVGLGSVATVSAKRISDSYQSAINSGNQDLASGHYSDAMGDFSVALNSRPNNQVAQDLLHQTQFVVVGNQFYQQHQWSQAIGQYQRAFDLKANSQLTKLAKIGLSNSKGFLTYYRQFVWNYNQALHLNQQGDFKSSQELLNAKILTNMAATKAPFKVIIDKARKLQTANLEKKRSNEAVETIAKVVSNISAPNIAEFDDYSTRNNAAQSSSQNNSSTSTFSSVSPFKN